MISHSHKCIFIHIPKVAGTSITSIFSDPVTPEVNKDRLLPFLMEDNKFDPPPPHLGAKDFVKYGHVTKEIFESYFKFAFVRNPWDRIVSEYKYRRHATRYDFKTFVFEHFPKPSWTDEYCHVIPQYDFLYDEKGNCLVDFVGRFENIQKDFDQICKQLDAPLIKLSHKNRSLSLFRRDNSLYEILRTIKDSLSLNQKRNTFKKYTEYYDDETIDWISKIYEKDIEVFNYKFGK